MEIRGKRKYSGFFILVFFIVFFLSACATTRSIPRTGAVENLMELVNSGDVKMMEKMTIVPMLVDGEIVRRTEDIFSFWTQIEKAGFRIQTRNDITVTPVDAKTYSLFGNTMEVKTFFAKYVPETAVIAKVAGTGGHYVFLLSGRRGKYPYIFGFTGPLK